MKKLLLVLLLGIGITVMGAVTNEQQFQIRMNVITSLNLEVGGDLLDFGDVNSTTVSNLRATEWIKVTGPANTQIKFETTQGEFKNGEHIINYRAFVSKTEDGPNIGSWGQIGDNGEYNAYMVAQIDHANLIEGAYTGIVTLEVSYN